ncbi:hypothetical protein EWW49_33235, partial [Pseudomonas syringae]
VIGRGWRGFVRHSCAVSARFGGAGHLAEAAASAVLDGFTHYRAHAENGCVRLGINWDSWRDVGMAAASGVGDDAHQRHLAVGMSAQEGGWVFDAAMTAQLPQLLISTTDPDTARQFYPVSHSAGSTLADTAPVLAAATALPDRLPGPLQD